MLNSRCNCRQFLISWTTHLSLENLLFWWRRSKHVHFQWFLGKIQSKSHQKGLILFSIAINCYRRMQQASFVRFFLFGRRAPLDHQNPPGNSVLCHSSKNATSELPNVIIPLKNSLNRLFINSLYHFARQYLVTLELWF